MLILNDTWFVFAEVVMLNSVRQRFREFYPKNRKFQKVITDFQLKKNDEVVVTNFSRKRYLFKIKDGLFYNIDRDQRKRLYVLYGIVKDFLSEAHDAKHYFGINRILKNLENYVIYKKTYLVK